MQRPEPGQALDQIFCYLFAVVETWINKSQNEAGQYEKKCNALGKNDSIANVIQACKVSLRMENNDQCGGEEPQRGQGVNSGCRLYAHASDIAMLRIAFTEVASAIALGVSST